MTRPIAFHTPKRGLEEAFILPAMLSLVGGTVFVLLRTDLLYGHFYREPVFGVVHVFTLGWMSMLLQGVLARLGPAVFDTPHPSRVLGWVLFALWLTGAAGVVQHMAFGQWFGMWTSGVCLVAAAILLPILHRGIVRRAFAGDWIARYVTAGMAHLLLAALVGTAVGLNKHLLLFPMDPVRVLGAHLHLAAVGWITFPILGFGRRLQPTLAPDRAAEPFASLLRFWLLEAGLLCLTAGFLVWSPLVPVGATVAAAGIALHAARPLHRLFTGRVSDPASRWVGVALCGLTVTAILGVAIAWGLPERLGIPGDRVRFAYGFLLLFGWITPAITGFALKLFPLWVWQERFGADLGVRPVPAMGSLPSRRLQRVTGLALTLGAGAVAAGLIGGWPGIIRGGVGVYAVGVFSFAGNFFRMARWELLKWPYRPSEDDVRRYETQKALTQPPS